jgi:hypothetical protein
MSNQVIKTKAQLLAEIRSNDPFVDESFGQLDTSGLRMFAEADLAEKVDAPDLFQRNDYLGQEVNKDGLRKFLSNLDDDDETIRDAASRPGADPRLLADHLDRQASNVGLAFREAVGPEYVADDDNFEALVDYICEQGLGYVPAHVDVEDKCELLQSKNFWTVDNLMVAFRALWESGDLPVYPDGIWKPLTAQECEALVRIAASGNQLGAVAFGIKKALQWDDVSAPALEAVINDPNYRPLVNELIMLAFTAGEASFDARLQTQFEQFAEQWAGRRPFTLKMLAESYAAFQQERKSVLRDKALGINTNPEPETFEAADFDRLSDAELERLRIDVLREKARTGR